MRGQVQLQLELPSPEWYVHVDALPPDPEPEPRGVVIIPLLPEDEPEVVEVTDSWERTVATVQSWKVEV